MAAIGRAFFDTSVLIAGMIELGGGRSDALAVMDAVAAGAFEKPMTAWHCCLEFYSVATRLPEEFRLSPQVALRFLREEILPRFSVHDLPAAARRDFLRAGVEESVVGGRIYDAHIAEVARLAGAELVITENRRHFTALLRHGIRVRVCSEVVADLERGR